MACDKRSKKTALGGVHESGKARTVFLLVMRDTVFLLFFLGFESPGMDEAEEVICHATEQIHYICETEIRGTNLNGQWSAVAASYFNYSGTVPL